MKGNFGKMQYPYTDNVKVDLRSYAQKAYDYITYLAMEAEAEREQYVQNALSIIKAFSMNHSLVNGQVSMIERRLAQRIDQRRRGDRNLPRADDFRGGDIIAGKVLGTDVNVKLRIDQFSGNVAIYGQYGMGKTNLNLCLIPQIIQKGIHVDIFDVSHDYRDILQIPGCENGLVLHHDNDLFNPLEPIGPPERHLQNLWEFTGQDYHLSPETREMLFNYSIKLYKKRNVYDGGSPPTLSDLREYLKRKRAATGTSTSDKNKIGTALRKINFIIDSFKNIAHCRRGYPIDLLDKFSFVSYEIGDLSEENRSWYMKLKLKRFYHKGQMGKERHKVNRVIVVDEAKGIFGKSRIGIATNDIKDMYTKSRSIGFGWLISDQMTTELSEFTRLASCQITFQHTVPKEIREIATGMGCSEAQKLEIPRLGRYRALLKVAEFPYPFPIMTYKSQVKRHIDDAELVRLMKVRRQQIPDAIELSQLGKRVRIVTEKESHKEHAGIVIKDYKGGADSSQKENVLEELHGFLRFIHDHPEMKLTDVYKALKLSGRKGNTLRNKARDNHLLEEQIHQTGGKGRPFKSLRLTDRGKGYINEKRASQ
jgi:hypothetical protein